MAKAYALTTVARQKTFLGKTDSNDDALLSTLIDAVTSFIENQTGKRFKSTTYTQEVYDSDGSGIIKLKNTPVVSISSVEFRNSALNEDEWEAVDTTLYSSDLSSGVISGMGGYKFPKGRAALRVTYTGGYAYDNANTFLSDTDAGDIEYLAWKLVAYAFNNRKGNANVQSESIGDYSVTFRGAIFEDPEIQAILEQYTPLSLGSVSTPAHSDNNAVGGW